MSVSSIVLNLPATQLTGGTVSSAGLARLKSAVVAFSNSTDQAKIQGGDGNGRWTDLKPMSAGSQNLQIEGDYAEMRLVRVGSGTGEVNAAIISSPQAPVVVAGPPAPIRAVIPDDGSAAGTLAAFNLVKVGDVPMTAAKISFSANNALTTGAGDSAAITFTAISSTGAALGPVGTVNVAASSTIAAGAEILGTLGALTALPAGATIRAAVTKGGAGVQLGGGVVAIT
jgi:hypothetical protein